MENIKLPEAAKLLIRSNEIYKIVKIHFRTGLVTLQESEKAFNTVSIKNVEFDFTNFTPNEIAQFWENFD